jgi:hypothetical protein
MKPITLVYKTAALLAKTVPLLDTTEAGGIVLTGWGLGDDMAGYGGVGFILFGVVTVAGAFALDPRVRKGGNRPALDFPSVQPL